MKTLLRLLAWLGLSLAALAAAGAALIFYFVWTPAPAPPHLSGALTQGVLDFAGMRRTYSLYAPQGLSGNAPLVMALHGSDGSARRIRVETGYAFERLADQHGFALVYPNAFEGNWNACNTVGDYSGNTRNVDDVGFLTALADALAEEKHIDRSRVFAVGTSRGGHMAFRLALEAPLRFRAVAAVAANVPAPDNFKCHPAEGGVTSIMIMNGMRDPLNPFNGGEVQLFGLYNRGSVLSSRVSALFFARLNGLPAAQTLNGTGGVERSIWRSDRVEIELVAVRNGGHSLPQPYRRAPRILGPTATDFDGASEIWAFFERQTR